MPELEWKEVEPEQKDWDRQINMIAYYGDLVIGSIVHCEEEIGWKSVIDGHMDFLQAESLEDAKEEMLDVLDNYCTDQINYYEEIQESLEELREVGSDA
jgi:hypothetical protein